MRYQTPPSQRTPRPAWGHRFLRTHGRRLGSHLLTLVLVVCMVGCPTLSPVFAAPPAANTVSQQPPNPTPSQIPVTYVTPQITSIGSIQETSTPWSVQLQPTSTTPTAPIALVSCGSPDYIFQGCPLAPQSGQIRTDAERRVEQEAITSVLQQYQLPDSARPLVLRYARNEVRATLFAQIEQAFQTQRAQRTPDQQLLVDTYTRLVREKHAQATRAALNEYQKWRNNPCGYQPPPGFEYTPPQGACIGISRALTPESPGLKAFVAYGVAKAYTGTAEAAAAGYVPPSVADPKGSAVFWATSSAALLGYSIASIVAGTALGASVGAALSASALSTLLPVLAPGGTFPLFYANLATFVPPDITSIEIIDSIANTAGGATSVAGLAAILVASVTTAITAGISIAREASVPVDLQAMVNGNANYDPEFIIQTCRGQALCSSVGIVDSRRAVDQELYANLVLTTLPDYPGTDPAPAAQPGDPRLVVGGNPVDSVQYTADDGSQHAFRMSSGPWFADRAGSTGAFVPALLIRFKDASGSRWVARHVGNQFFIVRTDIPPARNDYPEPRLSADLSLMDWSGNTITARVGG